MTHLSVIERQPNFPNEDLTDSNVDHVRYYLSEIHDDAAYANFLRDSLRMLHQTGHQALQICGVEVDYSEAEYFAFCEGFAAFEYVSTLVNPRLYDGNIAVANARELLVKNADFADLELANHHAAWFQTHPNTHGVIINAGAEKGETMKQLQVMGMGAQIACEFQMVA